MKKACLILFIVLLSFFAASLIHAQNEIQNMDIIDADIRDVLRSFGELGGYNVLMDKTVQGSVTLKFTSPVSVKDAIQLVALTYGYSYVWADSVTVMVGNKDTFKDFGSLETRVYKLVYATPDQATEALKVVIPSDRIGKDPRTNSITVKANALEHENIAEVLKSLDREVPQVNIEAKVEELSTDDVLQLGFTPTIDAGYDSTRKWFITPTTKLLAYEKAGKTRLIANPNISTTDNQEGQILIGEKYPIISKSTDSNGNVTYTANYVDIGTKLSVTPKVNSDEVVTVIIKAEISSIGEMVTTADGNQFPRIDTRQTNSVVRLRQGETFVLSGLTQSQKTTTTQGTPFLSKVPVIGWLFKTKEDAPNKTKEVCIFLTPHIVRSQKADAKTDTQAGTNKQEPGKSGAAKAGEAPAQEEAAAAGKGDASAANKANARENEQQSASGLNGEAQQTGAQTAGAETSSGDASTAGAKEDQGKQEEAAAGQPQPIRIVIDDSAKPGEPGASAAKESGNGKEVSYVCKEGDTVETVARKFGIAPESVAVRNGLKNDAPLQTGRKLTIPVPADHLYQIKPKETLWRISKRYGTTVELLMEINGIADESQVKSGQIIVLPSPADKIADPKY